MAAPAGIPAKVKASRALHRGERYAGRLPVRQLPRLAVVSADGAGELDVDLWAEKDPQGEWLKGHVRGTLPLTCQRGLHPYDWACDLDLALRLVHSEAEEARLLKEFDPYWVRDDELPLREMIEEEVLLALPMLPRCPDPDCAPSVRGAVR